ncbi:MAG TPA: hypothetical protein PKX56_00175 [Marmoricola sp.]|nr:hypothetical protein [Marmoricola sp.]
MSGKERCGIGKELRARRPGLVRQYTHEREPGMIINSDVDPIHAQLLGLHAPTIVVDHVRTIDASAATIGDPTELLRIDMDEISWGIALIAVICAARCPDPESGNRVELV